jgi:ribosomal subunit interface protein
MEVPLQLSFKDVPKSESIEALIHEKVSKLEKICDYIISCRIIVEKRQAHQDRGNPYRVRIEVKVPPGHTLVAKQETSEGDMHDPLNVVLRKVFWAMENQLRELTEKQRREVKRHPEQELTAIVSEVFADQGYGFIRDITTDDEIYFHRNSVLRNEFNRISPGMGVRFAVKEGVKGPQASTVEIVDYRT